MITDQQIVRVLNLTTHPPTGKLQREGMGTFLGPDSALIAQVRKILLDGEEAFPLSKSKTEDELELIKEIREVVQTMGLKALVQEIDHVFGDRAKSDGTTYIYKSPEMNIARYSG